MARLFNLIDGQLRKSVKADTNSVLRGTNVDVISGYIKLQECNLPDLKGKVIALDFETYARPEWTMIGQAALDPLLSYIRTIQVSDGIHSWLIDTQKIEWQDWLKKILVEAKEVIAHNARFEAKNIFVHLGRLKINWRCTQVASTLVEYTKPHSLASVTERWLGQTLDKTEQTSDWSKSLTEAQVLYALRDVASMIPLHEKLEVALDQLGMLELYRNVECKLVQPLAEIEVNGVPINLSMVQRRLAETEPLVKELEVKVQKAFKYLYNTYGDQKRLEIFWSTIPNHARVPAKIRSYKDVVLTKIGDLTQYLFAITGSEGPILEGVSIAKSELFDCIHRADFEIDGEQINLISMYLEYKRRSIRLDFLKRISRPWSEEIKQQACLHPVTRRIHTEFKYAVTGRILAGSGSGSEEVDSLMETRVNKQRPWLMNIQQFPRDFEVRACFGFESYDADSKTSYELAVQDEDGNVIDWESHGQWTGGRHLSKAGEWSVLSADYAALEAFILAHLTGDENLISAVTSSDFHSLNASRIYNVEFDAVEKWQRQVSKNVNYCTAYGGGPPKIAQTANMAFIEAGLRQKITISDAKDAQAAYFKAYPGIQPYLESQANAVTMTGWTVPTKLGRTRNIAEEVRYDRSKNRVSNEKTKAYNNPMQATNADILKLALIAIYDFIVQYDLDDVELGPPIHDEQMVLARREHMPEIGTAVAFYMKKAMDDILSTEDGPTFNRAVTPSFGPSWGHAH